MKNRSRKVLMICILACAMFLTTAISSFGLCAYADYVPKQKNTVYGPLYTPEYYILSTDYAINGVHEGNGDYWIPSNVILGEYYDNEEIYVEGCQYALRKIHSFHSEYNCWPGEADGIFGRNTTQAVKNFQRKVNIGVDGLVGKDTLQELQEKCSYQ